MNHIDLFTGIGGFSLASRRKGINTIQMVEIEEKCIEVLNKHFVDVPVHTDIQTYHPPKDCFLMTGGFPCTDISKAKTWGEGRKGLGGDKSGLWYEYLRCIKEGTPKYVIIENVSDLLNLGIGQVIQNLSEIGYDTAYTVIDSRYTGVPQRRRRVYMVSFRDGIPFGTDPLQLEERSRPSGKRKIDAVRKSCEWDLTKIEGGEERETMPVAYFTRVRSDQFATDGIASTLTKRDYKDFTDVILCKNGSLRKLSVTERLRLQGFPDTWFDDTSLTNMERYKFNGMTVNSVEWVLDRILDFDKLYGDPDDRRKNLELLDSCRLF